MSSSIQDNNVISNQKDNLETTFSKGNDINNTKKKPIADHQEDNSEIEHLEYSSILTTEKNMEISNEINTETISMCSQSVTDENNVNENNISNANKRRILEIAMDIAAFFGFILYLSDILTDILVSGYYFSTGKYTYGCLILFFVYFASLVNATDFYRVSCVRFCMVFIFNLNGVLLYGQITYMLYRKWRKKDYCKDRLNAKQGKLRETMFIEGLIEAYPQILVQSCILSEAIIAKEHISWLQYTSVVISTLGVMFTILRIIFNYLDTTIYSTTIDAVTECLEQFFTIGLFNLMLLIIEAAFLSSGIVYLIIIPFIVIAFMAVLDMYTNCLNFISKRCFPRNLTCKQKQSISLLIAVILTSICWYYTRNAILYYWPLTFDLISYLCILYCVLGLALVIVHLVQMIIVPILERSLTVLYSI